ncbi:MAG: branched-chain amino acid ABC transporter permease [Alphaproteobacteria bacterium]
MLQILFNGLVNGAILAPGAIGFTLMFGILRFPNFAIGAYVTVGAFAILFFDQFAGWHIVPATIAGMAVTALVVWASDLVIFRPMRNYPAISLLVVSIALSLILENVIRFIAGNDVRGFDIPLTRPVKIPGLIFTYEQLYLIALAIAAMFAIHAVLKYTKLGKAMRATADNFTLAEVRGIDTGKVIAATWLIGGALAGLAGLLAGLDLVIEPLLGWHLTIPIFAAAILGGIGSPYGAMAGAVMVGLAEEMTGLWFDPAYKVGVGFVIITLLLLFRPHGLFGQPEIKK